MILFRAHLHTERDIVVHEGTNQLICTSKKRAKQVKNQQKLWRTNIVNVFSFHFTYQISEKSIGVTQTDRR